MSGVLLRDTSLGLGTGNTQGDYFGYSPGIVSWSSGRVLVSTVDSLWISTDSGATFAEVAGPTGPATNNVQIGYTYRTGERAIVNFAGEEYVVAVDDAGTVTWTALSLPADSRLPTLSWQVRHFLDQLTERTAWVTHARDTFIRLPGPLPDTRLITSYEVRDGAHVVDSLETFSGFIYDGPNGARRVARQLAPLIDIEHNGDGTTLVADAGIWSVGPVVKRRAISSPAAAVTASSPSGIASPRAGLWIGDRLFLVGFDGDGGGVRARSYTTPSTSTDLGTSPELSGHTVANGWRIVCVRTSRGVAVVVLLSAMSNSRPRLAFTHWNIADGAWDDWTELADSTTPAWTASRVSGMLYADPFPHDNGINAAIMDEDGRIYYYRGQVAEPPAVGWVTQDHNAPTTTALTLDWSYTSEIGQGQASYQLRREVAAVETWWDGTAWVSTEQTIDSATTEVTFAAGWGAEADGPHLYYIIGIDQDARAATEVGPLRVVPFVPPAAATITEPTAGETFTGLPTIRWTTPETQTAWRAQIFQDMLVVRDSNRNADTSNEWAVNLPNGDYTVRVRWWNEGGYEAPYTAARAFTVLLSLPKTVTVTPVVVVADGSDSGAGSGLVVGGVWIRVDLVVGSGAGSDVDTMEMQRREESRRDHRTVDSTPRPLGFAREGVTAGEWALADYEPASGVEYQYRAIVTGVNGAQTVGSWAP